MKKLFEKAKKLHQEKCKNVNTMCNHCKDPGIANCSYVIDVLQTEYPNIYRDIIVYFIVNHHRDYERIMCGLDDIDAHNVVVSEQSFSNAELLNKDIIDFASFASYEPTDEKLGPELEG
jgi:hypothetical protein